MQDQNSFLYLSAANVATVAQFITRENVMQAVREALVSRAQGAIEMPKKFHVALPGTGDGSFKSMFGTDHRRKLVGTKCVVVQPRNKEVGVNTTLGSMQLCDAFTGELIAMMDAGWLTLARTSALGGIIAADYAPDAQTLGVLGSGMYGTQTALYCLSACKNIREIFVSSTPRSEASFIEKISEFNANLRVISCSPDTVMSSSRIVIGGTTEQVGSVTDGLTLNPSQLAIAIGDGFGYSILNSANRVL
jgi:ornithine cyclodeaminase/alanine dehydrogenase-like protein (mu-crystallin family)